MSEAKGKLDFGLDGSPSEVRHKDGHWFMVEEVLCHQQGTARGRDCWRMRVWGPMPYDPDTRGAFVMVARRSGEAFWWTLLGHGSAYARSAARSRLPCHVRRNLRGGKADPGQPSGEAAPPWRKVLHGDRTDGGQAGRMVGRPGLVGVKLWSGGGFEDGFIAEGFLPIGARPHGRRASLAVSSGHPPIPDAFFLTAAGDNFYSHDDY
jgi:hypothetical protein